MYQVIQIVALLSAIWVIYDVWTQSKKDTGSKVLWTVLALLFSIITALIYYFTQKKN